MSSEGRSWKVGSRSDLWTPEQDQIIQKNWPNYRLIHDTIGRTRQAIYKRGNELGLRNRQPLKWADEIANRAVEKWKAGLSARQIASLVGKTRCAVIGKLHRLGLIGSRNPEITNERRRQTQKKRGASPSPRKRRPERERTALPPAAPVPPHERIPFLETKPWHCRAVYDDGQCCGRQIAYRSFCESHAAEYYQVRD